MREPSFEDALRVLLLQAGDEGRSKVLFGESITRAADETAPFMIGDEFPNVYMECPLLGDPFLDITVLYSQLEPGMHVEHPAAAGTEGMLAWFSETCEDNSHLCCGYELDIKEPELPAAAIHFQPRLATEYVRPFCQAVGEPDRADLYLNMADRMPDGWPLQFFGMFRGRPGSPLRVCGYMDRDEQAVCAEDTKHLARAFDQIGFSSYEESMLAEVSCFLAAAPGTVDFQFDVFPDGSLSDIFAIDLQFEIEQPEAVQESFESGAASRIMHLYEEKGIADKRWQRIPEAAFARAVNMNKPDGTVGRYSFLLMPQWSKTRWRNCVLQPAKMYFFASAGFLENNS